jgi:hypothetical protein
MELLGEVVNQKAEKTDVIDVLLVSRVCHIFSPVIPAFSDAVRVHNDELMLISEGIEPSEGEGSFHSFSGAAATVEHEDKRRRKILG